MPRSPGNCPFCDTWQQCYSDGLLPDVDSVQCEICGRFFITEAFIFHDLPRLNLEQRRALSAAARQANEEDRSLRIDHENWRSFLETHYSVSVATKIDRLLQIIGKRSRRPGTEIVLEPEVDFPLISAVDVQEFWVYASDCAQQGFLVSTRVSGKRVVFRLTLNGWRQIEPRAMSGGIPGRCFVAMSFHPSLDDAYALGIKPAIVDCGFSPVCMKEITTNEGITDRILSEIRLSEFIVADFTGHRGGVYFEAGFARGLGRDVIWACRKDDLEGVHFDIRHLGHVVWETPADLRIKLAESIRANIIPKR